MLKLTIALFVTLFLCSCAKGHWVDNGACHEGVATEQPHGPCQVWGYDVLHF